MNGSIELSVNLSKYIHILSIKFPCKWVSCGHLHKYICEWIYLSIYLCAYVRVGLNLNFWRTLKLPFIYLFIEMI